MENNYLLAKSTVLKKYSKDNPYYPMFVLSLYGLFSKYPLYKSYIISIFLSSSILIEDQDVSDILSDYYPELSESFEVDECPEGYETYGISYPDYTLYLDDNNQVVVEKDNPIVICNSRLSNTHLLNVFIHEMSHLLKSYIHCYGSEYTDESVIYWTRNGLSYYEMMYDISKDTFYDASCFEIIDEVINTIQTADVMSEIKSLDSIIPDLEISLFFNTLDKSIMEEPFGYDDIVPFILPLWEDSCFKNIVENNIIDGNIDDIVNYFDNCCFDGSFDKLEELIKAYYFGEDSIEHKTIIENMIYTILSLYNNNKSYKL